MHAQLKPNDEAEQGGHCSKGQNDDHKGGRGTGVGKSEKKI